MRCFFVIILLLGFLESARSHNHEIPGKNEKPAALSGDSIYNIESQWTDQNGRDLKLSELRGVVRIAALAYTSCQYACPLITADMKKIEKLLGDKSRKSIRFTLFSIDPKRDTSKILRQYAKKKELSPQTWDLLTSSDDAVRELSATLGFKYKKSSDGEFNHSNIIFIFDRDGIVRHQQVGLNQNPEETLEKIKELTP